MIGPELAERRIAAGARLGVLVAMTAAILFVAVLFPPVLVLLVVPAVRSCRRRRVDNSYTTR